MTTRVIISSNTDTGGKLVTLKDSHITGKEFTLSPVADASAFTGQASYEFHLHSENKLTIAEKSLPEGFEQTGSVATVTILNAMEPGYPKSIQVTGGDHDAELFPGESVQFDVTGEITVKEINSGEGTNEIVIPEGAEVKIHDNGDVEVNGEIIAGGAVDENGKPLSKTELHDQTHSHNTDANGAGGNAVGDKKEEETK